jgi:predicted O-linked N-acetylglucosamine transferase (SPINDLY family)
MTVEQALRTALAHHQAGRLAEAEAIYRQVLARFPDHPDALHLLGVLATQAGRPEMSIELIGRAVTVSPTVAEYHLSLGEAYRRSGRWDAAIASLSRSIELRPDDAEAQNALGVTLALAHRPGDAVAVYQRAIALRPDHAWAHTNLGNAWSAQGRLDEAVDAHQRALALDPDLAEGHSNLGAVLYEIGRVDEAIASYHRAIALRPDHPQAYTNLGCALWHQGRLDEASAALGRAIALRSDEPETYNTVGNVFKDQGRPEEALAQFRKALELEPGFLTAASNYLYALHFHPEYDAQALLTAHRHWAGQHAEPLAAQIRPHPNDPAPDRRLRVGFLSPDFRDHPVGQSLLPLFSHHDRRQSEVVCYSDVRVPDRITGQIKALVDHWRNIVGLDDSQVADRIRTDGIDILVDLSLHTANNRLLVFARKPAPVQVTMLGMPGTTGLATMDYRLTDPYLDPPGAHDAEYVEQSLRLPRCYWCYQPPEDSPDVQAAPALRNGFITFGCLNQFAKVSRLAVQVWIKILQSLTTSRLIIHSQYGSHRNTVGRLFQDAGIAPGRVEFAARVPRRHYLEQYHELDLSLDPFPFGGGISTMDSLWMGVPVVTLAGRTAVGRAGVSILSNVGLPGLVAETVDLYAAQALDWAQDLARLTRVRSGLRAQMRSSPLLNGPRYAADVDAAFREMWKTWCRKH